MRKDHNACRPTNTMRFVVLPGDANAGVIKISSRALNRTLFMYESEHGRDKTRKLRVGDMILIGRCPLEGSDTALLRRVV